MFKLNFIIFIITLVRTCSGEEPYFSRSPKNVNVVQGESVTLPCEVTPGGGMTYYWELNGSKIANTTRRYQQGSNLHITRVDRERDSGQFTCIAMDSTTSSSITSSEASLNIQWIDEVSIQLQEPESTSFITPGSDVILRCHTDASGDVHYEWFRNADRLAKSDRIDIKKKRLHIKGVQPSDNGVYRCLASNEAGTKQSEVNFPLLVPGNQTALIQVIPKNQVVPKDGTAYFDCQYQHGDAIEWYFRDTGPLESNKKTVIHSNGTLQINDVDEMDQGLYNCVGIRSESTEVPQSYAAELKLAYIKNFMASSFEPPLSQDFRQIIAEGSFFQLTCLEPLSYPLARKWWLNRDGHTVSDSGTTRVDDDGRLIIDKVRLEDAGNYTCVAENIAGKTELSVKLIVTTKPEITSNPSSVTVEENEPAILTCEYNSGSRPYTTVKWKKDGKNIKHDDASLNRQRIKIFKHNGTLLIHSTQSSDRGEYVCEIITTGFNPLISEAATISVIETLKFAPPPVNKKLEFNSVAKVHCKAQGTPPPLIRWEKDGISSENFKSHITDMNGTLHFNGVLNEDKGWYTCLASNSQGIINATIYIDVVVAPKFSVLPKNPTEANEGQVITIDCVVEGDPKPTIQWDKNLKMNDFDQSRFTVLENGTLVISEVRKEDENKYGCTAGNSAGLNRKEVQLIVHSRDGLHSDGDSTVTKAVLITMSVAGAYIVLVVGLMAWCRYRRRSRKLPVTDATKAENGDVDHTDVKDEANGHCAGSSKTDENGIEALREGQKSDGAETTHSQSSGHSKKSKSNYDKLTLSRTHLRETKLIGRGEFGDVMVAKISKAVITERRNSQSTTPSSSDDREVTVLVKVLTQTKDENTLSEFKREIDMFSKLCHENVTKLYGLCRESEPHYMILEHTDWGDLKQFLVATQKGTSPPLTPVQSVGIVHQLSRGMDYLASSRFLHRDLAARNCLVTSTLVAKVGLPRLTRDPYSQEYCKHVNNVIPLRWLPYEAVYEDEYSTKSDVYSFAVLIWEIFNQGELPFPKTNDSNFLNKLKEKKLEWKCHHSTPEALQKLQQSCWDVNPQNRPTFTELSTEIEGILKNM